MSFPSTDEHPSSTKEATPQLSSARVAWSTSTGRPPPLMTDVIRTDRTQDSQLRRREAIVESSGSNYLIKTTNKEQPTQVLSISLDELKEITRNFSTLLGQSSHAEVFFGALKDHQTCAVKMLNNPNVVEPYNKFLLKVQSISRLEHNNVVQLLSYCIEGNVRALVYEYSSWGSLHDILHGKKGVTEAQPPPVLSWAQRVKIALTAAEGLEFLHQKAEPCIIHSKITSSNILLFDNDVAKIEYGGVSRDPPLDWMSPWLECRSPPRIEYDPPECALYERFSKQSDIFSFGVVLLELLTGLRVLDPARKFQHKSLVTWLKPRFGEEKLQEFVDPRLRREYPPNDFNKMAAIASRCLEHGEASRPSMSIVAEDLRSLMENVSSRPAGTGGA